MALSRSRQLQLIQNVKDENYFRKDVLIPVFRNMNKFEQVIDNHGATEKGTDIVLVEKATFGGYRYTSVILKTLPINNATSNRKDKVTASNISQQVSLAITAGHQCNLTNRLVKFNSLMVITNQVISNTAREILNNLGQQFHFHELRFLQGEDLLDLLNEHLPNFYYYQSGVHARVAAAIQAKCEQLSDLQNLPQFSVKERALIEVFVKPQLRSLESKLVDGARNNRIIVKTPDQILSKVKRVLIIGEAGSGKSIIARETVLRLLSENARDTKPKLPILVKAHDLIKSLKDNFVSALNEVCQRYYNLDDFDFEAVRVNTDVTLIIDGLDEIVDLHQRDRLKSSIIKFGNENRNLAIIVTTRRTQDINDMSSMSAFKRWEILPFDFTQVREFISKWFTNREDSRHRLLKALEDHELLNKLPNTPLVLTLLAILFDSDDYKEIPANLAELYRMFVDLLLGKWNLDRRVDTMHNANIREYLAMEIAFQMHTKNLLSITEEMFVNIVVDAQKQRGLSLDSKVLIEEFTEQSALLVYNDKDDLEFRHLSFQEFLTAQAMYKRSNPHEVDNLVQNFEQSWWTKVLYFYCGLRQDTPEIFTRIISRLSELETRKKMTSIFELGYLVQAAYLTPIDLRIETVEIAFRQFHECINSLQNVSINDKEMPEGMVYFAFVFLLSIQFSSRMLQKFYREKLERLIQEAKLDDETSFVALSLAICMAHNNDLQALTEVLDLVKTNAKPKQLMALHLVGKFLLDNIPDEGIDPKQVNELKTTLKEINKWFRSHPSITKNLLESSKASKSGDVNSSTQGIYLND